MTRIERSTLDEMIVTENPLLAEREARALRAARDLIDRQAVDIAEMEAVLHDARLDGQAEYERGVAAGREETLRLVEEETKAEANRENVSFPFVLLKRLDDAIRAKGPVCPPLLPERREALLARALETMRRTVDCCCDYCAHGPYVQAMAEVLKEAEES